MEDILCELGYQHLSARFQEKSISLQSFKRILSTPLNSQPLMELVMKDCGISSGQMLAICDKVEEYFLNGVPSSKTTTTSKTVNLTPPAGFGKNATGKRVTQLLKQPVMSKSPVRGEKDTLAEERNKDPLVKTLFKEDLREVAAAQEDDEMLLFGKVSPKRERKEEEMRMLFGEVAQEEKEAAQEDVEMAEN